MRNMIQFLTSTASSGCRIEDKPVVVALHCSGADGSEWRKLAEALTPGVAVMAPDLIGSGSIGWHGRHAFRLADDANRVLSLIGGNHKPVHVVGHSYGGAVALKIAAMEPSRIASLSLYEPSAFHLLREIGPDAVDELAEIEELADAVVRGVSRGALAETAATFVDYWNGEGAWISLREDIRTSLMRWMPHAAPQFQALLSETTPLTAVRLPSPVLVLRGEHALPPSRLLAEEIAHATSYRPAERIPGAGHMGPITHADLVNARIAVHIAAAEAASAESSRARNHAA
jgi:pimeloyl-ACP methyl ester carboxylesterase